MSGSRIARSTILVLSVAAAYFVAGRIGLRLAFVNASATAVWPPSGIAIAALLLFGRSLWPAVFVGAFLVNFSTTPSLALALGIAAGNTLEAVAGAWLVRRYARGVFAFDRPSDVFRFAFFGGLLCTAISPTVGVTSLGLAGRLHAPFDTWFTWWLGDVSGVLVVAPLVLLWMRPPRFEWTMQRRIELAALAVTLVVVGTVIFSDVLRPPGNPSLPYYLLVPVLLWAAYRFTSRESATAVALLTGIAIVATLRGLGPYAVGNANASLVLLEGFMSMWSIASLAMNAAVAQQREYGESTRMLNERLEQRVSDRTERLRESNENLRRQNAELADAEEQLRMSEMRLREAQRVARIGSWEFDVVTREMWWSQELYALFGIDPDDQVASCPAYLEHVHPEDRRELESAIGKSCRDGSPIAIDHRLVHADGSILGVHTRGHVITDGVGRALRIYGTAQDVSERHSSEAERAQLIREQAARREAVLANQLKDEFLAVLSHELRNPLNAIVVWSQILLDRKADETTSRRAIEAIARNAQVQAKLITDLLDLSRLNSGRLELHARPLDPLTVIEQAVDTMRPAAAARTVMLTIDFVTTGEVRVNADPERLQQIVWNLVSNAIHFSPEGGEVTVCLRANERQLELRVEDEGPGIAPELLPVVFDATRRGAISHPGRSGGLGLGLAIVRRLTELHGGSVFAANRESGTGAVLTVRLPVLDRSTEASTPAAPVRMPQVQDVESSTDHTLRGVRVLLVEDDMDSADGLVRLLTRHGAQVTTAETCADALERFELAPPQVLISDIALPDGDGYGLLEQVRGKRVEDGGSVPAIALTAYAGVEHSRRATRAGFQVHFAKPFESEELIEVIARLAEEPRVSMR